MSTTINVEAIPDEMKAAPRWLVWRLNDGKKVPYDFRSGKPADPTAPSVWTSFTEALAARKNYDGLGFALGKDGFEFWSGVDLDDCRRPNGTIDSAALAIAQEINSYTEVSVSGTGLHILTKGPTGGNHTRKGLEVYDGGRYLTVTGQHLPDTPTTAELRAIELRALVDREFGASSSGSASKSEPALPEIMGSGERNDKLFKEACRLREAGYRHDEMLGALRALNHQGRVSPPLDTSELQEVAQSAMRYSPKEAHQQRSKQERVAFDLERERAKRIVKKTVDAEERGPITIPAILTLRERLARERASLVVRISGLQLEGQRVLLEAQYKVGKTTFVMNLVRALLDGVPFLDTYDVSAVGRIVLLDFEMGEEDPCLLDDWYRDVGIEHDDRLQIVPLRGKGSAFNLLDAETRAAWAERLKDADYLIIDCLRPILDALGLDESHDAGTFLEALGGLMADAGIRECLLVVHMGHQNERARGDSRILDWPDVIWSLNKGGADDDHRYFKAMGRGVLLAEQQLDFNDATKRLAIADDGMSRKASVEERVLKLVQRTPGIKKGDVYPAIRGDEKKVRAALNALVANGRIAETAEGRTKTLRAVGVQTDIPF